MQKTSFGLNRRREPGSTSLTLIDQLKNCQNDGWARLSDHYGPLIYHWSRKSGLSPHGSADIVQEVFRSVTTSIGGFQKVNSADTFRGWLRTITKNKVLDHLRAYSQRPKSVGGTDAHIRFLQTADRRACPSRDSTSFESQNAYLFSTLDSIRGQFSTRTWHAFWLSILNQLTSKEIGDELGMSSTAVRLAKSRILKRLREVLDERDSDTARATAG